MEKVTIDYNRLCLELEKQGKTKADLSRDMTKNKNFVGLMEKNPDQPAEVERLMCLLLGLEQGSLIKQEEATGSQGEIKILENLHKEMREIHQAIIEYGELIEKIWSKVHANTLQLEKVKEDVKECAQVLKMTDYDKAVRFLKETLAGGRIDGAEVLRMADATGIKRADLNKAKRDIGVDTAQTVDTVTILSVATLHDEFGFGTQRCDRFIKRFNKKAECIMDDMASWNDYIKTIKEELGIELGIRENK